MNKIKKQKLTQLYITKEESNIKVIVFLIYLVPFMYLLKE